MQQLVERMYPIHRFLTNSLILTKRDWIIENRPLKSGRAQSVSSMTTPFITFTIASISSRTKLIGYTTAHVQQHTICQCSIKSLNTLINLLVQAKFLHLLAPHQVSAEQDISAFRHHRIGATVLATGTIRRHDLTAPAFWRDRLGVRLMPKY